MPESGGSAVAFCIARTVRHKRGRHGCFLFVDYPLYFVLADRTARTCSLSRRMDSDTALPARRHRRSRGSWLGQRSFYATHSALARSSGHLNSPLEYRLGDSIVRPRKTSVFIHLQALWEHIYSPPRSPTLCGKRCGKSPALVLMNLLNLPGLLS